MAGQTTKLYRLIEDDEGRPLVRSRTWWETAGGFRSSRDTSVSYSKLTKTASGGRAADRITWHRTPEAAIEEGLKQSQRDRKRAEAQAGQAAERHRWLLELLDPKVHILHERLPLCRFTDAIPGHWPPGHRWVPSDEPTHANCERCLDRHQGTA
jgi:hypothetical protein